MPTVECSHTDCQSHGVEICIARRVKWQDGQCSGYEPRVNRDMLQQFRSNCRKENGKYKSSRVTGVLK